MALTHACVVAGHADVPAVRVLVASLRRHHPEVRILAAGLPGAARALAAIPELTVVALRDLAVGPIDFTEPEATALTARPALLSFALAEGAGAAVLLAPDAEVLSPMSELVAALGPAEVVLVPRLSGPLPDDGARPDAADLAAAGSLDGEIVAVGDGPEGGRFLAWWAEQATGGGDLLASASRQFAGVTVLDEPGYDVSHWNIHERPLARDAGGALTAAGRPVRLMRFSGFRPDRPWWLAQDGSRVRVLGDPVLAEVCRRRARAMLDAGWTAPALHSPDVVELRNALRLDDRVRRLLDQAYEEDEDFGDLEDPAAADALLAWLSSGAPVGAAHGLNRYTYDVWRSRSDLQAAYPDPGGADAAGYVGWLWVHGRTEMELDTRLLPPAPDWYLESTVPSVTVVGYLRGSLGLGQAARLYTQALQAGGVQVGTVSVPLDGPDDGRGSGRRRIDNVPFEETALADPDALLVCVNAPQIPDAVDVVGEEAFASSYVIGQWGWETDEIPAWWMPGFERIDELWVYSSYVAGIFAAVSPKPVVAIPLPVERPAQIAADHGLTLPPGDFTFLFAFDFLSTIQRKNPVAVVEAFKRAFAPGEGPVLVLKTTNAELRPQEHDRLRHLIGDRPDVAIVDAVLSEAELAALFAQADCYVSLHRSEGFGLTLAEAMVLGKPVIATAHGGNLDFMTSHNSYLVDCEMVPVGDEAEHYPAGGTWAEPSVEHAAALMREVHDDRAAAAARGDRARRDIERTLSVEAVGALARKRLERLPIRRGEPRGAEQLVWPVGELAGRYGSVAALRGGGGLRGRMRSLLLRAMRPYTAPAGELDRSLVVSVEQLARRLEALQDARERDRARIARLEERLRGRSG